MLGKRIISSALLISAIIAAIMLHWFFNLLAVAFIILGLLEFFALLENKGITAYKYFGTLIGVLIPISIVFRFETSRNWELAFILLALLSLIFMQFKRRTNAGVIVDISTTLFGIFYVSFFFSFLIKIRNLPLGAGLAASVILITKLGDIGAFLVGTRFGKTPLVPRISPKKSVEGSIGGLAFSALGALACGPFLNLGWLHLVLLGLGLGIMGQLGDLSESLIKRDCQVKDSGVIFPGLGGVLDSIDSLLFSTPAFYFYISTISR
ncbi:MAG: phosphatidate cytidylyltransferase [Candidatus Omnitrophota bacterium]|nr:phosphatidate cytidylyltransferase [Candidatus Omnitrophota bacterium]